nr:unnamed protein product [Spirometra erinaceieuropaei]
MAMPSTTGECTSSRVFPQLLLFADDWFPKSTSGGDMQRSMDLFDAACNNFGLVINAEKTVVVLHPPSEAAYNEAQLQVVDNCTCLCGTPSRIIKGDNEVVRRITQAIQKFGHWKNTV